MKKKLLAIVMAASFLAATLLTACGGDTEADAPAPSSSAPASSTASTDSNAQPAAADGMVSDETFAAIQQNYAVLVQYHTAIAEAYNSDEIAANPEIEEVMNNAADLIEQMGQVSKETLTEEDAVTLNDYIIGVVEVLTGVVEEMETTGAADGAEGTPVSDETFGILQQNWATLTDMYNQMATAYNNGEIEKNEDFEKLMNQAAEILEQIQVISRDELTEEKAVEVNDTMILIQEGLGEALGLTG